ncbi:MAG TPA: o-succinylbenzoate synthase [Longimicrobiales bacterium]|nr:o-succinylbenzoate synthase [Longimicrobiales bacterium]
MSHAAEAPERESGFTGASTPVRVERATLREVPLELVAPFVSSRGRVERRRVVLLELRGGGLEGWGECVAQEDPSYWYETVETAWHVLADFVLPGLVGRTLASPEDALTHVAWMRGHPMARATVEMAAWDLLARAAGVSLREALGGTAASVPVGVSVGLQESDEALAEAVDHYLAAGYARVKVKIEPGRDVETLGRLRERFPDAVLMADANAAYTLEDAHRLRALDPLGLTMIEQPLAPDDLLGHARLQEQLETPVCLDESIASEQDARLALELGSCRVINLKPGRVGGLGPARRIHDLAGAAGIPLWCGGMLETGIGRAHNLALASLEGFTLPGDLSASRRYWARDIVEPEHEVVGGRMAVPAGPGIGVAVDAARVEALATRRATFGEPSRGPRAHAAGRTHHGQ